MVNKHLIGRILMFLLLFLVLIGGLLLVFEVKKKNPETTSAPSGEIPTPQTTQIGSESRWATDSAVLEIESNVKSISQDIDAVELKESKLLPPTLDMEVKF
jgi:hypothetical protein